MNEIKQQEYGVALEAEGFIIKSTGEAVPRIEDRSAAEWVINQIARLHPQITPLVSLEQASVMLETKTLVHPDELMAIQQIQELRAIINDILGKAGCQFLLIPVLDKKFEFVPASSDPNSRSHQLVQRWSGNEGDLYATAVASFQINDSRIFKGIEVEAECLEIARRVYNIMTDNFDAFNGLNLEIRDWRGKTRMENLLDLLPRVKREQFIRRGFSPQDIVIPPHFITVAEMQRWMCAHSDVDNAEHADPKDAHAVTVKVKRPWIVETRMFDSVQSEGDMRKLCSANDQVLSRVRGELFTTTS